MSMSKNPYTAEATGRKIHGKEDTVKETQEGCLSRPIRKKSELSKKFRFSSRLAKMIF